MLQKNIDIKKKFQQNFQSLITSEIKIAHLFYEIFLSGTAYVVGGYFRDFLNNQQSRDIDVIVDINNTRLIEIIQNKNLSFKINRHNGVKIFFNTITLDIWTIENNWAFKSKLVTLNDDDKLLSIAKGCFFNYDSLVINLNNFSYNIKYYREFEKNNELDILQKLPRYKNLNPTIEANILRAFYIRNRFKSRYSENTLLYLLKKIGSLRDKFENELTRLEIIQKKYPKYNDLTNADILSFILEIKTMKFSNNQQTLDF